MKKATLTLALTGVSTLLLSGSAYTQAQYRIVPGAYQANDVTPDGKIVVGTLNAGGAYRWDMENDPAPTPIGGQWGSAISADGSVITGNMEDPASGAQVAGRWTAATGWVPIGGLSGTCGSISTGMDISSDGNQIVGLGWFSCSGRGFRWTNGQGMDQLMNLGNGQNRCSTISGNGDLMGGFAQGSFSRTPAIWFPDTTGVAADIDDLGEVLGMNEFGTIYLGTFFTGTKYEAFYDVGGTHFFLGTLNPDWSSEARDVNANLSRIVGNDTQGLGSEAWIWNIDTGIERLETKLTGLGVQNVPFLSRAMACSDDGDVIVGHNFFGDAWVVTLPVAKTEPYGCVASSSSLVVLSGTAGLGNTLTIGIDDATGSANSPSTGALLISLGADPNFPCGTPIPGAGELLISLPWALGLLAPAPWTTPGVHTPVDVALPTNAATLGLEFYVQGLLTAPGNTKLTRALKVTVGTD